VGTAAGSGDVTDPDSHRRAVEDYPVTPDEVLLSLLDYQLSFDKRREVLMEYLSALVGGAWHRGWDDCETAFQRFHNDEQGWPVKPEKSPI
jgi:hypothetical protein